MQNVDMTIQTGTGRYLPAESPRVESNDHEPSPVGFVRRQMTEVRRNEEAAQRAIKKDIERAREYDEGTFEMIRKNLRLAVFEPTGDLYAKIFNADTGELLKTIPSEALLKTYARMEEYVGMLIDQAV